MQELEQQGQEEEEETGATKGDEELKQEATNDREESKGENPLEKYMKMVLEARGNQQAQVTHSWKTLLLLHDF